MHSSWLYNRYHVHSSLRTTPFQSLFGRPYRGKIVAFGQTVCGLDLKADKYRPAWIRGAWIGKDSFDMDLIATDGQSVVRTKAIRRIGEECIQRWYWGLMQHLLKCLDIVRSGESRQLFPWVHQLLLQLMKEPKQCVTMHQMDTHPQKDLKSMPVTSLVVHVKDPFSPVSSQTPSSDARDGN